MGNFWIRESGVNTLKGVEGDLDNPPVLPAFMILSMLNENQQARDDFDALFPIMAPDEQERLLEIHRFSRPPLEYPQTIEDKFQKSANNLVIRQQSTLPVPKTAPSATKYSGTVVRLNPTLRGR